MLLSAATEKATHVRASVHCAANAAKRQSELASRLYARVLLLFADSRRAVCPVDWARGSIIAWLSQEILFNHNRDKSTRIINPIFYYVYFHSMIASYFRFGYFRSANVQ